MGSVRRPPSTDPSTGQELSGVKGLGWEDEASRSPTWGQHGQALSDGKVAPTPKPYHSVSAGVSNHSCPSRSMLQLQVEYRQSSPPQEQAQQGRTTGIWGTDQKSLSLEVLLAEPQAGGASTLS